MIRSSGSAEVSTPPSLVQTIRMIAEVVVGVLNAQSRRPEHLPSPVVVTKPAAVVEPNVMTRDFNQWFHLCVGQGERSVDEYLCEFIKLTHFVGSSSEEDEKTKVDRFYLGLRDDLRLLLLGPKLLGFHALVTSARELERDLQHVQRKQAVNAEKLECHQPKKGTRKSRRKKAKLVGRAPLLCFTCGKAGHIARVCRSGRKKRKVEEPTPPRASGAMTSRELPVCYRCGGLGHSACECIVRLV